MDSILTLYAQSRVYLNCFNRKEYPAAFTRFREVAASDLQTLSSADPARAAQDLLSVLAAGWGKKRSLFRSDPRENGRLMTLFYLIPAALEEGQETFVQALGAEWNRRWPEETLGNATYAELRQGFEDSLSHILGFRAK